MTTKQAGAPEGLEALNRRVARELELLTLPAAPWVPETKVGGEPVLDVAIIGAGMAGLAAAAAFRNIGLRDHRASKVPGRRRRGWRRCARRRP